MVITVRAHCNPLDNLTYIYIYILELLKADNPLLTLTVLVTTIDAQWEGMGDVGSARYEPALLPHARPEGF